MLEITQKQWSVRKCPQDGSNSLTAIMHFISFKQKVYICGMHI